jgi:hypothetical protein
MIAVVACKQLNLVFAKAISNLDENHRTSKVLELLFQQVLVLIEKYCTCMALQTARYVDSNFNFTF